MEKAGAVHKAYSLDPGWLPQVLFSRDCVTWDTKDQIILECEYRHTCSTEIPNFPESFFFFPSHFYTLRKKEKINPCAQTGLEKFLHPSEELHLPYSKGSD